MGVEFFSEVDTVTTVERGKQIASSMPAWYFTRQLEQLEDEIRQTRHRLASGRVPHNKEHQVKARLAQQEKKLDQLKASKPKFEGKTKDEVATAYKELGEALSEAMPTRTEEHKRLVNPATITDRMHSPCIKVSGKVAEIAIKNGMKVSKDGKMTQVDASRLWKMSARVCEEGSNTERLRRD